MISVVDNGLPVSKPSLILLDLLGERDLVASRPRLYDAPASTISDDPSFVNSCLTTVSLSMGLALYSVGKEEISWMSES